MGLTPEQVAGGLLSIANGGALPKTDGTTVHGHNDLLDDPLIQAAIEDEYGKDAKIVWTWHHNYIGPNPFDPHVGLKGATWTDAVERKQVTKATIPSWPGGQYHPQDHAGCLCSISRRVVSVTKQKR